MKNDFTKRMKLKQWAEQDRPREKLLLNGRRSLSEAELMAILIGSGSKDETAVELSKRILSDVGNDLGNLARLSLADLCAYKGIGEAKGITIIAALELGRRRKEYATEEKPQITSSEDVYRMVKSIFADLSHEEFWILLLNTRNKVIGKELISKGGMGVVAVDAKTIFQTALQAKATGIVLSHNHPSGSLEPSAADKSLTDKIIKGAKYLDIRVLDHVIVSDEGYYSFIDNGEMPSV